MNPVKDAIKRKTNVKYLCLNFCDSLISDGKRSMKRFTVVSYHDIKIWVKSLDKKKVYHLQSNFRPQIFKNEYHSGNDQTILLQKEINPTPPYPGNSNSERGKTRNLNLISPVFSQPMVFNNVLFLIFLGIQLHLSFFLPGRSPQQTASPGSLCATMVTLLWEERWAEPGCGSRPGAPRWHWVATWEQEAGEDRAEDSQRKRAGVHVSVR